MEIFLKISAYMWVTCVSGWTVNLFVWVVCIYQNLLNISFFIIIIFLIIIFWVNISLWLWLVILPFIVCLGFGSFQERGSWFFDYNWTDFSSKR